MKRVRFQGTEYLLIGDIEGPITTREAFENGDPSYAHLGVDGLIRRHRNVIGTEDDLTILGDVEGEEPAIDTLEGLTNLLTHPGWIPGSTEATAGRPWDGPHI